MHLCEGSQRYTLLWLSVAIQAGYEAISRPSSDDGLMPLTSGYLVKFAVDAEHDRPA